MRRNNESHPTEKTAMAGSYPPSPVGEKIGGEMRRLFQIFCCLLGYHAWKTSFWGWSNHRPVYEKKCKYCGHSDMEIK
jgi:hypothetical protein